MTRNLALAAIAASVWLLSATMNSVDGLGQMSDLLAILAQALCLVWALHGVFLFVRRAAYRDVA
ncbi:hypothetical protein [Asaia krungthepensis]|nr:hypothetical protein [Asaia krungthepensis]